MPKTSSEDRLAAVLEDLKEVLKHPHPKTPFLEKGTKTNDAITKLETIFEPPKKDNNNNCTRVIESPRVQQAPRMVKTTNQQQLQSIAKKPTIYPNGMVIRKKIGQTIQRGTVSRYDNNRKYYWIDYENSDSKEMQHRYVEKYKRNNEPDIVRRKSNRIQQQTHSTTDAQLTYAVYDEETGKMMEMQELRNHSDKKKREEWDRSYSKLNCD